MERNDILSAAYSIMVLVEKGLTMADVLREVKATGMVPDEEWDKLDAEFADAEAFWGQS